MLLYLIRHARAFKESRTGQDEDRELEPHGLRQASWLASQLVSDPVRPGVVLTSPVLRAQQTALPIAGRLNCVLSVVRELDTDHGWEDYARVIARHAHVQHLAIIGHNPTLEALARVLLGAGAGDAIEFHTAQATLISLDPAAVQGTARLMRTLRYDDAA